MYRTRDDNTKHKQIRMVDYSIPLSYSGHPFALHQSIISARPASAALKLVLSSQGQPFARAHCSTSRWPSAAAQAQVSSFQGQSLALDHFRMSRCPPRAARAQVRSSHGHWLALLHCSTSNFGRKKKEEQFLSSVGLNRQKKNDAHYKKIIKKKLDFLLLALMPILQTTRFLNIITVHVEY